MTRGHSEPERSTWLAEHASAIWWVVTLAVAGVDEWVTRGLFNPDALSYIAVGEAFFNRQWQVAINAYWNPLYAVLYGAIHFVAGGQYGSEATILHALNFGLFVIATLAFQFFLGEVIRFRPADSRNDVPVLFSKTQWLAIGWGLHLATTVVLNPLHNATPDMCLAACIYAIGGLLLRIRSGGVGAGVFFALGLTLGVACLARTAMFPQSVLFMLVAVSLFYPRARPTMSAIVALMVGFLLLTGPWVAAMSYVSNRVTVGDSGRLNYMWVVDGTNFEFLEGNTPYGKPDPGIRKIFGPPAVYEIPSVPGAFLPYQNLPARWFRDARPDFQLGNQLRQIKSALQQYKTILVGQFGILFAGVVIVLVYGHGWSAGLRSLAHQYFLWLPALAALGMYGLVHVDPRYVQPYVVLLAVSVLLAAASSAMSLDDASRRLVSATVCVIVAGLLLETAFELASHVLIAVGSRPYVAEQLAVARGLQNLGLQPGDPIAAPTYDAKLWVRYARLRVVAITEDKHEPFWSKPSAGRERAFESLAASGVKAFIAELPDDVSPDWTKVAEPDWYVQTLTQPLSRMMARSYGPVR